MGSRSSQGSFAGNEQATKHRAACGMDAQPLRLRLCSWATLFFHTVFPEARTSISWN